MWSSIRGISLLTLDLWQMKILLWENIDSLATGFSIQVAMEIEVAYPATWMTRRFFQTELNLNEYQVDLGILCSQSVEHCELDPSCPLCTVWKSQVIVVYWFCSHLKIINSFSYSVILMKKTTVKTTTLEKLKGGTYSCFKKKQTLFLLCHEVPPPGFSSLQETEGRWEVLAQSLPGR